eukprot:scaffold336_cov372-Pavlova_lutheri.AAC.4
MSQTQKLHTIGDWYGKSRIPTTLFNGQMGTNKPTLRQKFSHYSMTLSAMFTTLIRPNMLVICQKPGECKAPFENGL